MFSFSSTETNCPRNTSPCISDTLFVETNSLYQSDPESSDSDDSDDGSEGRSDTVESTATQQTQALAQQGILGFSWVFWDGVQDPYNEVPTELAI